jgi:hydrocephalus-inducing protein
MEETPPAKKPSDLIKTREERIYKVHISNDNQIPKVVNLEREALSQCFVPVDRPLFQPEPSNLIIEGFTPFKTYELAISFRNIDKVESISEV